MTISHIEFETAIKVNSIGKEYKLGAVASGSIKESIARLFERSEYNNRSFCALLNVSFDVKRGEVLGIIGKNGAGKSTLLRILSRITYPTTGNVVMNGKVASLLEVGTGFHPELTGRENVFLNGSILGMSRKEIKEKFNEILEFSGVEKFIDTPVKHYSSGMYVRLAFSVAAHLEPDILVIDEVLAVGDVEFQNKCLGKMKDIAGKGRTVLFVSHNMAAVQNLCSRAILLENGKIVMSGKPKHVIEQYLRQAQYISKDSESFINSDLQSKGLFFKDIAVSANEDVKSIFSGTDMLVSLWIEVTEITKLVVRLDFYNSSNELLFICNNYHSYKEFDLSSGCHKLECLVESLPLYEGEYRIAVVFFKNKEMVGSIDNAINFQVAAADFFGTGKISKKKLGFVLQRNQWNSKRIK